MKVTKSTRHQSSLMVLLILTDPPCFNSLILNTRLSKARFQRPTLQLTNARQTRTRPTKHHSPASEVQSSFPHIHPSTATTWFPQWPRCSKTSVREILAAIIRYYKGKVDTSNPPMLLPPNAHSWRGPIDFG